MVVDYSKSMFADKIELFKLADIAALLELSAPDLVSYRIKFWNMLVFIDICTQVRLQR